MLIPADRFSTLPEGCPVRYGDRETTIAGREVLYADLSTPAAVRAFAPALIVAVKGLQNAPKHPPGVAWEKEFGTDAKPRYVLVWSVEIYDNDWRVTKGPLFSSPTPEACLLNGLKAALDAAKRDNP